MQPVQVMLDTFEITVTDKNGDNHSMEFYTDHDASGTRIVLGVRNTNDVGVGDFEVGYPTDVLRVGFTVAEKVLKVVTDDKRGRPKQV